MVGFFFLMGERSLEVEDETRQNEFFYLKYYGVEGPSLNMVRLIQLSYLSHRPRYETLVHLSQRLILILF